jgi:hypothetical protein
MSITYVTENEGMRVRFVAIQNLDTELVTTLGPSKNGRIVNAGGSII